MVNYSSVISGFVVKHRSQETWGRKGFIQLTIPGYRPSWREVKNLEGRHGSVIPGCITSGQRTDSTAKETQIRNHGRCCSKPSFYSASFPVQVRTTSGDGATTVCDSVLGPPP